MKNTNFTAKITFNSTLEAYYQQIHPQEPIFFNLDNITTSLK